MTSSPIASKAPVERSSEVEDEQVGHLYIHDQHRALRLDEGRIALGTHSSATVAVTVLPFAVFVIVTVRPQLEPEPYMAVSSATTASESACTVPQAPATPFSVRGKKVHQFCSRGQVRP